MEGCKFNGRDPDYVFSMMFKAERAKAVIEELESIANMLTASSGGLSKVIKERIKFYQKQYDEANKWQSDF